jgi:hypothetical protein
MISRTSQSWPDGVAIELEEVTPTYSWKYDPIMRGWRASVVLDGKTYRTAAMYSEALKDQTVFGLKKSLQLKRFAFVQTGEAEYTLPAGA